MMGNASSALEAPTASAPADDGAGHSLEALAIDLYGARRRHMVLRCLMLLLVRNDSRRALVLIRLMQHFHVRKRPRLARMFSARLRRDFGCYVQASAIIGPGLRLPHPNGIVIGAGVRIGANCTLYHQVTFGGARQGDWQAGRYPVIGDNAIIFAGAKVIGPVRIGQDATVAANAVVLTDVPDGYVAVGIPAQSRPDRRRAAKSESVSGAVDEPDHPDDIIGLADHA